ncbi:hypothetical protein Pan216_42300 [Planctomycetes bacterium Pan216]|uniref:Lipoprotein n=1 Tax=Kolteria novifilia TaxID=2527975 RepID=A0A518B8S6_9BACT|nr:hypothetical protein Pan216_42300 [Planctomycetes bacterium Pan216]
MNRPGIRRDRWWLLAGMSLAMGCSMGGQAPWKTALDKKDVILVDGSRGRPSPYTEDSPRRERLRGLAGGTTPTTDHSKAPAVAATDSSGPKVPQEIVRLYPPMAGPRLEPPKGMEPAPAAKALVAAAKERLASANGYSAELVRRWRGPDGRSDVELIEIEADGDTGEVVLQWRDEARLGRRVVLNTKSSEIPGKVRLGSDEPGLPSAEVTIDALEPGTAPGPHPILKFLPETWLSELDESYGDSELKIETYAVVDGNPAYHLWRDIEETSSSLPKRQRHWYIDIRTLTPTAVITHSADGEVVESLKIEEMTLRSGDE